MKVVTLNRLEFGRACQRLFLEIMAAELWPDIIVGIARGGEEVVKCLKQDFPDAICISVKCSRPTSRNKKFLSPVLRYLPSRVNILLRQLESKFLTRTPNSERNIERPIDKAALPDMSRPKVLIVDDAVDSGYTLKTVEQEVRRVWPDARVWTSALTVTTEKAILRPDIVLYKEMTLIRFPWSADTRND